MNKALVNYKGLYGDNQYPLLPNFIHYEALETRSKMYDWEINRHLHTDLYQIFIIASGDGVLVSENNEIELKTPCIITIPSHTLHGFAFQPSVCGEVITFSESFLESLFKNSPNVLLELNHLKHLSFEDAQTTFGNILLLKNQRTFVKKWIRLCKQITR